MESNAILSKMDEQDFSVEFSVIQLPGKLSVTEFSGLYDRELEASS